MQAIGGEVGSTDRLQRLFDWFTGLDREEAAAFAGDVLATVMLRPLALLLSSAGILLMSGTAALMLDVDPIRLARSRGKNAPDFSLAQYVNDRSYAA